MKDRKRNGLKVTDVHQTLTGGYKDLGPRGKAIYRARCKELLEMGELYFCDLHELFFYARSWELFHRFQAKVKELGDTLSYIDRMGNVRYYANPAVKASRDALSDIITIGSHFGFQPLSRTKLAIETESADDPVEVLMKMVKNDHSRDRKN